MSEVYGAEHLLRMLVTLPQMVAASSMDPGSVEIIAEYAGELMRFVHFHFSIASFFFFRILITNAYVVHPRWMEREKGRIFQAEYDTSSGQYQNISRS